MTLQMKWIKIGVAGIAAIALFTFLGGQVVRLLWNWLLPPLFGWHEITFWQGLGFLALCRILFGGLAGPRGPRMDPGARRKLSERLADRMADRVAERWDQMTPEQRERFRQRLRERLGFDPAGGESQSA